MAYLCNNTRSNIHEHTRKGVARVFGFLDNFMRFDFARSQQSEKMLSKVEL